MKNLFKINAFTYLFFTLSLFSGYIKEMFLIFIILVFHELGHFFLMKINSIDVKSITLYPYGGMIKSNMLINTNSFKVFIISLGGIISQLILMGIMFLLYKINFVSNVYYDIFFKYNISIIVFNLLPIYPLDGFKILNSILELFLSFRISLNISFLVNIFSLIVFFVYLYVYKVSNYLIIIFLLVNLFNYIREIKYILNKFYVERIIYNIKYKGLVSVNSIDDLYKNKFNYIGGIDEKNFLLSKYNI